MEFQTEDVRGLTPQTLLALMAAEEFYKRRLLVMTVLAIGKDWVEINSRGTGLSRSILLDLQKKLDPMEFYAILKDEGKPEERFRITYYGEKK